MRIIAFSFTTPALLAGRKSVTRRIWTDKTATCFKRGDLVQAYNRSPRNGGERVGYITITEDPYKEALAVMPDGDYEAEGFRYLQENAETLNSHPYLARDWKEYFDTWRKSGGEVWVVRFELLP